MDFLSAYLDPDRRQPSLTRLEITFGDANTIRLPLLDMGRFSELTTLRGTKTDFGTVK